MALSTLMVSDDPRLATYLYPRLYQHFQHFMALGEFDSEVTALNALLEMFFEQWAQSFQTGSTGPLSHPMTQRIQSLEGKSKA